MKILNNCSGGAVGENCTRNERKHIYIIYVCISVHTIMSKKLNHLLTVSAAGENFTRKWAETYNMYSRANYHV